MAGNLHSSSCQHPWWRRCWVHLSAWAALQLITSRVGGMQAPVPLVPLQECPLCPVPGMWG